MSNIVENLCIKFAIFFNLNVREIYRKDNDKYLTRYYIFRKPLKWLPSVYLHCFHSSDEDMELHNHDWNHSISFILSGSYLEERFINNKIVTRILKPGNINYIRDKDFHRVELKSKRVWTLFISGSKTNAKGWGFLTRDGKRFSPWQEHVTSKRIA